MIYIDYNGENQDLYIPRASASSATGSTDNDKIVFLVQAEYDALDPKEDKLYVVTDTPAIYVGETFIGPCCTPGGLEDLTISVPEIIVGDGEADIIVTPSDADVDLTFTSSDPSIATIDENGHITVIEDGEVTFCVQDSKSGLQDCQTVSVERPYFMVSPLDISAPASGGTYTIRIASNYPQEWSINGSSWMNISPSTGTGSGNINVTIQENEDITSRSGSVFIKDGSTVLGIVPVSQEAAYFSVIPTAITDNVGTGGTYTLNVTATGGWTVVWDAFPTPTPWCEYTPTSGTNSGTITVTLAPYITELGERVGDLIITDSRDRSITVRVTQEGVARLSVSPESIDDIGTGGTYVLNITSPGPWTATWDGMDGDWCEFSPVSGSGSDVMTVILQPFISSGELVRMGNLAITSNGNSVYVYVDQHPYPAPTQVTVQQLIDEGYAEVIPGAQ